MTRELPTYSVTWNAISVVGTTLELINPSNNTRTIRLTGITYTVAAATHIIAYRSQAATCTGGTSTSLTPVRRVPNNPASGITVKLYSAAPTAGSREEIVLYMSHTGASFQHTVHQVPTNQPITIPPGYSLEIHWSVGTSTQATLIWTEE